MSEVSYSNVPPMMAAIKSGDIEAIRSLLHAGHSPAGELYLNVSFDEQFIPSPKVGYDTF